MIVIHVGATILVDYEALWVHVGRRPIATIRKHCKPIATHKETGRLLYDADASKAILDQIPQRTPHRRNQHA